MEGIVSGGRAYHIYAWFSPFAQIHIHICVHACLVELELESLYVELMFIGKIFHLTLTLALYTLVSLIEVRCCTLTCFRTQQFSPNT